MTGFSMTGQAARMPRADTECAARDAAELHKEARLPEGFRPAVGLPLRVVRAAECYNVPPETQAILIDLNGTVSLSEQCYREALRVAAEHLYRASIPPELFERVRTAWHMSDAAICRHAIRALQQMMPALRERAVAPGALVEEQRRVLRGGEGLQPLPAAGMLRFIRDAHGHGLALAIVTGSTVEETQRTLGQFGIADCVSVIVSALDCPIDRRKPHPLPYRLALCELGVDGGAPALALEDSIRGSLSAFQADLTVVLNRGRQPSAELASSLRAEARQAGVEFRERRQIILVPDWTVVGLAKETE